MRKRPLALGEQRVGEVIEGTPTAVTPVAFQPWRIVLRAPGTDVVALATGTLERAIFPPQGTELAFQFYDLSLYLCDILLSTP